MTPLELVHQARDNMKWRKNALCRRAGKREEWFRAGEDTTVEFAGREVSGRQAQLLAVDKFCSECDVQWECALWAIWAEEPQGVWAMTIRDLLWMQRLGWGDLAIQAARESGTPVRVAVRQTRECAQQSAA